MSIIMIMHYNIQYLYYNVHYNNIILIYFVKLVTYNLILIPQRNVVTKRLKRDLVVIIDYRILYNTSIINGRHEQLLAFHLA